MWMNLILRVSSAVHRAKEKIIDASILKTIFFAFEIVLLELLLLIMSLPLYIFIAPEKFSQDKEEIQRYRLKRKASLIGVASFALFWLAILGGIFLVNSATRVNAASVGWSFDNPIEYVYDSSQIQIVDGMAVFQLEAQAEAIAMPSGASVPEAPQPATEPVPSEPASEPAPAPTPEPVVTPEPAPAPASEPAPEAPVSEQPVAYFLKNFLNIASVQAAPKICATTIQPVESLVVPKLIKWTGFIETANKNGGEIFYQLSDDNGMTWYYWQGSAWKRANSINQNNIASVVNANIDKFPIDKGQILFKAYLVSDCTTPIQLIDVTITYEQEKEDPVEIVVVTPNGGESLVAGSTSTLLWTSVNTSGNVKIEYSKDNFVSDINVIVASTSDDGSYDWTVPNNPSSTVKVRVSDVDDTTAFDVSDTDFSILRPASSALIVIRVPNGGEQLVVSDSTRIVWASLNTSGNVKIEYSKDNFVSDIHTIVASTVDNSVYTWTIPNDVSDTVRIRVSDVRDATVFDISNADFSIVSPESPPSVLVSYPNGEERLMVGASDTLLWTSVNTSGNVKIEYSKDNFVSDINVIVASTSDDGSYDWTVPNNPSSTVKVRVSDVDDTTVKDVSDTDFTIAIPASITVTYPDGGEKLTTNSFANILWASVNTSGNVKIEYSKDNFVSDIHTIVASTTDNGSYEWKVSEDPSTTVKIRISDVDDTTISSTSKAKFIIVTPSVGPVSRWSLDDNTGCTANDDSDGNNGVLSPRCSSNSPSWTTGTVNSALSFDGVDDYVSVDDATNLNPNTALTLSAWIRWNVDPATGNSWASIVNKDGDNQYRLHHNETNTTFEFALTTSAGSKWIASTTTPRQNVWYLVVGTYDGQTMNLYVNGSLEGSDSWSGYVLESTSPLNIGSSASSNRYFNGKIDEVGFWNRALSATEVNELYLDGNNTKPLIVIDSVAQQADDGYVYINYTITDAENNFIDLVNYEYSLTGDFTGEEKAMTGATGSAMHNGISSLSSSPIGTSHTFVWNVSADLDVIDNTVYVRLRPTDGIEVGDFVASSAFAVDARKPVITALSGRQVIDSTRVEISYDLSDNDDKLKIELDISEDGGLTWGTIDTSVTGDVGSDVTPGTNKVIIWDAGIDFANKDEADMKVRLRATDARHNVSEYANSDNFAVDTLAPRGLGDFKGANATVSAIVWSWTPVNYESHFRYYEIWYGKNATDVQGATGTAMKWSTTKDSGLASMGTASTSITGLAEATVYYAKIWAVDEFGNQVTLTESQFTTGTTPVTPPPSSGGGGGGSAPDVTAPFKPILDQPQTPSNQAIVKFSGTAEPGSYIDLYVDGQKTGSQIRTVYSSGAFTGTVTLSEGDHELYVIAIDGSSNASERSDTRAVVVDLTVVPEKPVVVPQQPAAVTPTTPTVPLAPAVPTLPITTIPVNAEITNIQEGALVEAVIEAEQSPILQTPRIVQIAGIDLGNNIKITGKGTPNATVAVFIASEQAIVHTASVDKSGDWSISHSQNDVELSDGDHEVYALTLDSESQVKSKPSEVKKFTVKKNQLAAVLSYFDFTTTLLTVLLALLGIVILLVRKNKTPGSI